MYSCKLCDITVKKRQTIIKHMETAIHISHVRKIKKYKKITHKIKELNPHKITCKTCLNEFKTQNTFMKHNQIHLTEYLLFNCENCQVQFKYLNNLYSHKKHSCKKKITSLENNEKSQNIEDTNKIPITITDVKNIIDKNNKENIPIIITDIKKILKKNNKQFKDISKNDDMQNNIINTQTNLKNLKHSNPNPSHNYIYSMV